MSTPKASQTIRLSDTIDQYARRVHINVRSGKVTLVHRWKDSKSSKSHTQRTTLEDEQAGKLLGVLARKLEEAVKGDPARNLVVTKSLVDTLPTK